MSKPFEFKVPSGATIEVKSLHTGDFTHKKEEQTPNTIWDILGISHNTYQQAFGTGYDEMQAKMVNKLNIDYDEQA